MLGKMSCNTQLFIYLFIFVTFKVWQIFAKIAKLIEFTLEKQISKNIPNFCQIKSLNKTFTCEISSQTFNMLPSLMVFRHKLEQKYPRNK
jgi:hypothetical protein